MRRAKEITCTLAVILLTALCIYNTQREVPKEAVLYWQYMHIYFLYLFTYILGVLIVSLIGYRNRIIKACYIGSIGLFCSMLWKAYNYTLQANNYYDTTLIGCCFIVALIYLLKPYLKDLLSLFKHFSNKFYALCQRRQTKGKD